MPKLSSDNTLSHRFVHALTIARLPIAVSVLLAAVYLPSALYLKVALACLVLMEASDVLDGFFARRLDATTEVGAMLDPYADSVSRFTFFYSLALTNNALFIVPYIMFFRDITVAYTRIYSAKQGKSVSAKYSGKAKAGIQGLGALILVIYPILSFGTPQDPTITHFVSWIIALFTALSAIEYIYSVVFYVDT